MRINKSKGKNKILISVVFIIILFLSFLRTLVNFITDYQWFVKNNFKETFLVSIFTQVKIFLPLFIVMFLILSLYLMRFLKRYYKYGNVEKNEGEEKIIKKFINISSAIISAYMAFNISRNLWTKFLYFFKGNDFNILDPIFSRDIGFYIFKLPILREFLGYIIYFLGILILITLGFYVLMLKVKENAEIKDEEEVPIYTRYRRIDLSKIFTGSFYSIALRKIAVIGGIIFLLIGANYFLKGFELMYSPRGVAYGASYTDVHVSLFFYRIILALSLVTAVLFSYGILKNKKKISILGPILMTSAILISAGTALVVQQLVVEPDELSKEKEYLEYNIEFTQKAFNLDKVTIKDFPAEQELNSSVIERNRDTVDNIRVNDYRPLQQTYNQIQGIRLYYGFGDVDLDRYYIDGKYSQVFISPRELDINKLDEEARTWLNTHIKFTHGYGVVMSPVNKVTKEGQPELLIKNIPPVTESNLNVLRPEIYFGEMTNNYIIVGTKEDEFDYPAGSDNAYNRYEGNAGISLNGFNRILYSYRMGSMKMLVSNVLTNESKIVFYRNIKERVERIAPFILYDDNPYPVIDEEDGKLYWVIDGYTYSNDYPYSQPVEFLGKNVNYLRNSVKVVIDAYEGSTKFYRYDENDPMLNTLDDIFSDLFVSSDEMPETIKSHIKYPQDYFNIQSKVYKNYHVENPIVFYNGEDIWDIANEKYMDGIQTIESNYVMFKLPDGKMEEFALLLPYTPREKANMTSVLVARNDGEQYGKLFLYKFSKDKTIQGPMMIESRIDQDSTISPQFTLWGQEGSNVLRGNVIVVPIEDALLYVEPIYLQADNENSLPEMKRVVISYKDKIIMENDLETAIEKMFGNQSEEKFNEGTSDDNTVESLLNKINSLFNESKDNMEQLEVLIKELNNSIK